jgi:hypothetical protein
VPVSPTTHEETKAYAIKHLEDAIQREPDPDLRRVWGAAVDAIRRDAHCGYVFAAIQRLPVENDQLLPDRVIERFVHDLEDHVPSWNRREYARGRKRA